MSWLLNTLVMRRTLILVCLSLLGSNVLLAQRIDSTLQSLITSPAAVSDLILEDTGNLLVAGNFTFVNGQPAARITRLRPDGARVTTFAAAFRDTLITALALQSDGKILVGGYVPAVGDQPERGVVLRLQSDGSVDPSFRPEVFNRRVLNIKALNEQTIVVGGLFSAHAGVRGSGLATLFPDGTLRQMIALDPPGATDTTLIYQVAPDPQGTGFYVSGNRGFEGVLHRIGANGVVDTTFQLNTVFDSGDFMTSIQELALVDNEVWLTTFTWEFNPQVVQLDETGQLLNRYTIPNPQDLVILPDGRPLVACTINGEPDVYLVEQNQLTRYLPGPAADDFVSKMVFAADGGLFVAGRYSFFKGFPSESIMKFSQAGTPDLSFNARLQRSGVVRNILELEDGRLLVAGEFTQINQQEAVHLARLFPDGSLDPSFAVNTIPRAYSVNDIALTPTGDIMVATQGRSFDDASYFPLLRLRPDGTINASFDTGLGDVTVGGIDGVVAMENGRIIAYGPFSINVDNGFYRQLAAFTASGDLDISFMDRFDLGAIHAVIRAGSGKWMFLGRDIRYEGGDPQAAVQIFSNGLLDPSFFSEIDAGSEVFSAVRLPSTKFIFSGRLSGLGASSSVFRLFPDGRIDRSFAWSTDESGEAPENWPRSIAPQAQDSFLISNHPGERDVLYLQMDTEGRLSSAFRVDYPAFTSTLLLPNDTTLLVGGRFINPGGGSGLLRILLNQERTLSTSLLSISPVDELNVFPNPASGGRFFVERPAKWFGPARLDVFTLAGEHIQQVMIHQPLQEVRLSPKQKGTFLLRLQHKGQTARSLLIIPN